MDKGANLDVWDWWGRTPLWIAVDRKAGRRRGGGGFGGGGGGRGGGRGGGGRRRSRWAPGSASRMSPRRFQHGDHQCAAGCGRRSESGNGAVSLGIFERLGNQGGLASGYGELGILAQHRGDYTTAENHYRQALGIFERLGDQGGMAASYHELGRLAYDREDYASAEKLFRQSLFIEGQLGNQTGVATSYSALAHLAKKQGNTHDTVISHLAALDTRLRLGIPAGENLKALSELRHELGTKQFRAFLPLDLDEQSAENLWQLLDQWDESSGDSLNQHSRGPDD